MTTCKGTKQNLISYLSGELSPTLEMTLEEHLSGCKKCRRELQDIRHLWEEMDIWNNQPVPPAVASSIIAMGKGMVDIPSPKDSSELKGELKGLLKPLAPLFLGLLAALISSGIVSTHINLSLLHPLELTGVGALWTLLYSFIFYILLYGGKGKEFTSWRSFAQASLVAIGIFLLFTLVVPLPHSVHFCRYYSVTQPLFERLSVGGSFFLFGVLYALIPMGIAAYLSGGTPGGHPLARGSLAGILFVLLVAPGIYLQCAPFTLGVLIIWFGGAVIGSLVGGVVGYMVRYRLT